MGAALLPAAAVNQPFGFLHGGALLAAGGQCPGAHGARPGIATRRRRAASPAPAPPNKSPKPEQSVLHGDLNGNNILLAGPHPTPAAPCPEFEAKVADFGLSRLLPMDSDRIVTRTHGTITHMAPEVRGSGGRGAPSLPAAEGRRNRGGGVGAAKSGRKRPRVRARAWHYCGQESRSLAHLRTLPHPPPLTPNTPTPPTPPTLPPKGDHRVAPLPRL